MKVFFKRFSKNINKEKLKDISLVLFAFALVGIGYVNFANNDTEVLETYAKATNSLGDVELVSANVMNGVVLVENDNNISSNNIKNNVEREANDKATQDEVVTNSGKVTDDKSNYFSEVKLNRDIMYDQILETYQKMIDSTSISNEQKSIAVQETQKITKQKSSILVAEELIKLKGFDDVVVLVNDDNVDVIVRIAVLSKEQVVQIQNIIIKELGGKVENISISTK